MNTVKQSIFDSADKIPHVCGGVTNECDEFSCDQGLMDECYRYDPSEYPLYFVLEFGAAMLIAACL